MTYKSERSKFVGIDGVASEDRAEDSAAAATPDAPGEATACGPGCDCGAVPTGRKTVKIVVTALVVLAVVGALIYGGRGNAKQTAATDGAAASAPSFSVAQPAQQPAPGAAAQSSEGPAPGTAADGPVYGPQPQEQSGKEAQPAKATGRIGENLESMNDLNRVAMSQDAVFIFIPGAGTGSVDGRTRDAVLAAQQTLKNKNIALGLYTLPASSPDYSEISQQVQGPAIIVASKGRSMAAVSGEVTEEKLLQAFVSSQRTGGCCPSGSGASCPTR